MTATDDFIKSLQGRLASATSAQLSHDDRNPDDVASSINVGRELGVPAVSVAADPEPFNRELGQRRNAQILQSAPATAQWLGNIGNAGLGKDDVETLSVLEGLGTAWDRGVTSRIKTLPSAMTLERESQRSVDYGRTYEDFLSEEYTQYANETGRAVRRELADPAAGFAGGFIDTTPRNTPATEADIAALTPSQRMSARYRALTRSSAVAGMSPDDLSIAFTRGSAALENISNLRTEAEAILKSGRNNNVAARLAAMPTEGRTNWEQAQDTVDAIFDNPADGAAFLLETSVESLPIMAAALGTTVVTRSPKSGIAVMGGGTYLTESSVSAMDFLDERGIEISDPEQALALLQDSTLMADAHEFGHTRGLVIGLFAIASGGMATQTLSKNTAVNLLAHTVGQAGLGGGGEAVAQVGSTGDIASPRDIVIEGLAELPGAAPEAVIFGGQSLMRDRSAADNSGGTAADLVDIDALADQSNLRGRSPEAWRDFLRSVGLNDADINVPAEGVQQYFQDQGLEFDQEAMDAWGIDADAFGDALLSGGDITVSVEDYAANITGTPDADWIRQNGSRSTNEMSISDAEAFNAQEADRRDAMLAEAELMRAEDDAARADDVQIYDDIFSQLRAAGRGPDEAGNTAMLYAAIFRTSAARMDTTALALAESMGVRIQGTVDPEQQRRRGELDIRLNTLRSQGERALAPSGRSILDFIRDQGGVRDTGGDVASMDVPSGVISETREQVQERASQPSLGGGVDFNGRGRGLDDLGRAAIEAGYFPDLQGGADIGPDGTVTDEAALILDAIQREVSGAPTFIQGEGPNADLVELMSVLSEAGIDLAQSNDDIAAALEATTNEGGQEYNQDGDLITDSDAFREWFGDSKVVDAGGEPMVMYHGTGARIEAFDTGRSGQNLGDAAGIFLTSDKALAGQYAKVAGMSGARDPNTITAYVSAQNPLRVDAGDAAPDQFWIDNKDRLTGEMAAGSHDGAMVTGANGEIMAVVAESSQVKSVENTGGFDANDANIFNQGALGSIQFPVGGVLNGTSIINLFEGAKMSTALHEFGHFFLEAFKVMAASDAAPDQMRDDMAAINDFLGVQEGEATTRDQHETWARSFEQYLMEGKSPSLALMSSFARFKSWLTRIYRSAAGLNVNISPEIREVMDRMIATDQEIADMRDLQNMRPLFDGKPAGMSQSDFDAYQRIARRGVEQAEASLLNRTMDKIRRETESWFKAERAAVRAEVEASFNKKPVYRLTEMLANQRWLGGTDQTIDDIRIDSDVLVEMFGAGVLQEINRSAVGGKRAIYAKGGEHPQSIADMFGFSSIDDMIEALQNAGKRKDAIDAEADRIMLERHGDPLTDGSIEEAAAEAIHSTQQAASVAAEIRTLADMMGRDSRGIKAKVYKARAAEMISEMTVRRASKPNQFLMAERKAARVAQDEFAKVTRGGAGSEAALGKAMAAKEQQLLNQYLYREAVDFSKRLQSGRERVLRYNKDSIRKKVGADHVAQIDQILAAYDFKVRSERQIDNSESLSAYVQRMIDEGREGELDIDPDIMSAAQRKNYTRLSVAQLDDLMDTIANIDHIGRRTTGLVDRQNKRDFLETSSRVAGLVRDAFGSGKSDKQAGWAKQFFNRVLFVDTIAAAIDKAEFGFFYESIKRPLDEGASVEQAMNVETAEDVAKIFEVYSQAEITAMNVKKKIDGANGYEWTKQQILALALNTGNKGNLQRVLDPKVDPSVRLTDQQMKALLNTLDQRDWDAVQSIWDKVQSFQPELSAVSLRRKGVKMKTVDAQPVQTKFGTYRGGYYPIGYDAAIPNGAVTQRGSGFDAAREGNSRQIRVGDGMTRERQAGGGGRALSYDLSVALVHMRDTTYLIAMSEAVDNAARIMQQADVRNAFLDGGQSDAHSVLKSFLMDIASGPMYNSDPVSAVSRAVKNNFTISRLAFNLKTVALQVTGAAQSAAVVGKMNMLTGYSSYLRNPASAKAMIMEKSAFMRERETTMQKDIYDQSNDLRLSTPLSSRYRKAKNAISAAGFLPMVKVQFYSVDAPTWIAAYDLHLSQGDSDADAVLKADRIVARAQGSGLMTDRSGVERGTLSATSRQQDFVRLWTTLGGYMVTKMNRGYLTLKNTGRDISEADSNVARVRAAASGATDMMLLYVAEGVMMAIAYSLMSEGPEEDEKVLGFVARETVGSVLGGLPFVKDAAGGFRGYDTGGVAGTALGSASKIWEQTSQFENDPALRRAVLDGIGLTTGMPTTATQRLLEQSLNAINGDDVSIAEALFGSNPLDR